MQKKDIYTLYEEDATNGDLIILKQSDYIINIEEYLKTGRTLKALYKQSKKYIADKMATYGIIEKDNKRYYLYNEKM